jgi:hypothetical protein
VIKSVQDAGSQISSDDFTKDMGLGQVAGLWAGAGDMTEAMKTVTLMVDAKDNETELSPRHTVTRKLTDSGLLRML